MITLSALSIALTTVFLYLATVLPTVRVGLVAIASLLTVAAVVETGIVPSILVFTGASLLGLLILPDKVTVLIYALFLGYYPIVKSLAERIKRPVIQWAIKLVAFNAAFAVIWFVFRTLVFSTTLLEANAYLTYLAANLAFVLFDIGLTRLIGFYIVRISKYLNKNNR